MQQTHFSKELQAFEQQQRRDVEQPRSIINKDTVFIAIGITTLAAYYYLTRS